MKVFQLRGYPTSHYFVEHDDWFNMIKWLNQNKIEWEQESSSVHGIGFTIKNNFEWFTLKWS